MEGKIPVKVRRERNSVLSQLSLKKQKAFYESFIGDTRKVLVEKSKKPGTITGFTDNYLKVEFPYEEGLRNELIDVKLTAINGDYNMDAELLSKPKNHLFLHP